MFHHLPSFQQALKFQALSLIVVSLLLAVSCSSNNNPQQSENKSSKTLESSSNSVKNNTQESILAYLNKNVSKLSVCDGEIDEKLSQEFSSVYLLEKDKYLIEFLCFMGAYQGNYQYLLYQKKLWGNNITPLKLEIFESDTSDKPSKITVTSIAGLPNYEVDKKVLTVVTKYRGLADCGAMAKYQWENDKFKLLEYRSKEACDGRYVEPEKYSQIYP